MALINFFPQASTECLKNGKSARELMAILPRDVQQVALQWSSKGSGWSRGLREIPEGIQYWRAKKKKVSEIPNVWRGCKTEIPNDLPILRSQVLKEKSFR